MVLDKIIVYLTEELVCYSVFSTFYSQPSFSVEVYFSEMKLSEYGQIVEIPLIGKVV
jgi:hypothetical protein